MPRVYKPSDNKRYKKYDKLIIEQALDEYNASSEKSYIKIAQKYNIPKSVLHRHNTRYMKAHGGQTALSADVEEYLILYINACSEWGYPLETIDLRLIIKSYLDRCDRQIKKFKGNMPGPDFVKSFLKRHNQKITVRLGQNIKRSRAAVSPQIIATYFDELEVSLRDIPLGNIINYDETNLSDDPGRKKVLVKRSVKYPERVMNHSKSSTSLMMACSADGKLLPPYVVYKAKHMYDCWILNGPKGARYNRTASGWFDSVTFEDWVRTIIIPYFKDKMGPKVLIGDNLSSHFSIELIKECKEQNISFIFLPASSTHLTQPLDVSFFRPMKNAWREILFKWKKTDGRSQATIPKTIFPNLLKKLIEKLEMNMSKNILAGFEKCGISPINSSKVLDRLPNNLLREEEIYKEAIDSSVLSLFEEMRYGGASNRSCRKKKVDVVAGRSVGAGDNSESDESNTENLPDAPDADTTSETLEIEKTNSKIDTRCLKNTNKNNLNCRKDKNDANSQKAGPSRICKRKAKGIITTRKSIEGYMDSDEDITNTIQCLKNIASPIKTKSKNGKSKTTNKSLIKKTKVYTKDKTDQSKKNSPSTTPCTNPAQKVIIKQENKVPTVKLNKNSDSVSKTGVDLLNDTSSSQKLINKQENKSSKPKLNTKNGRGLKADLLNKTSSPSKMIKKPENKASSSKLKRKNGIGSTNDLDLLNEASIPTKVIKQEKRITHATTICTNEPNILNDDSFILNDITTNENCNSVEINNSCNNNFIDNILKLGIENIPITFEDFIDVTQEIEIDNSEALEAVKENKLIELKDNQKTQSKIFKETNSDKQGLCTNKKITIISNVPGDTGIKEKVAINNLRRIRTNDKIKTRITKKYFKNDAEILKFLENDSV